MNGAIVVTGPSRPAGTFVVSNATWHEIGACGQNPPRIGFYTDADIQNDILIEGSIVLLTVYAQISTNEEVAFFAELRDVGQGMAKIRVTMVGAVDGARVSACAPPAMAGANGCRRRTGGVALVPIELYA